MDIYDILFDLAELLVPLFIVGLILIWMMRDVPKEDRPWNFLKRRIGGNLTPGEIEKKKEDAKDKVELKMMASNFAFTNVPRNLSLIHI